MHRMDEQTKDVTIYNKLRMDDDKGEESVNCSPDAKLSQLLSDPEGVDVGIFGEIGNGNRKQLNSQWN